MGGVESRKNANVPQHNGKKMPWFTVLTAVQRQRHRRNAALHLAVEARKIDFLVAVTNVEHVRDDTDVHRIRRHSAKLSTRSTSEFRRRKRTQNADYASILSSHKTNFTLRTYACVEFAARAWRHSQWRKSFGVINDYVYLFVKRGLQKSHKTAWSEAAGSNRPYDTSPKCAINHPKISLALGSLWKVVGITETHLHVGVVGTWMNDLFKMLGYIGYCYVVSFASV